MRKIGNLILILGMLLFFGLTLYLYIGNLSLKNSLSELDTSKEKEFQERLKRERGFINKDLEERYRADIISYQAMARRLELEKKKIKELQEQLQGLKAKK